MLLIAEPYRPTFTAPGLNSFDSVTAASGPGQLTQKAGVFVEQCTLRKPGLPPSLSFPRHFSKARCKHANYDAFTALDIRCAEPVARDEQRDWPEDWNED